MVWLSLILSVASLALSVWAVLRCGLRTSHIEKAPEVVQAESVAPHDEAWQRFEVHHRAAFERAVEERRKRARKVT
jgi:hypothetical protein